MTAVENNHTFWLLKIIKRYDQFYRFKVVIIIWFFLIVVSECMG